MERERRLFQGFELRLSVVGTWDGSSDVRCTFPPLWGPQKLLLRVLSTSYAV